MNTFTEHHGGPWSHKDMQHTMMVILDRTEAASRLILLDRAFYGGLVGC